MFKFIRSLFIILICMSYGSAVSAQDVGLLPNGMQTFLTNDGKPLSSGKVYFYVPNTSTLKSTWQDSGQAVANTNPVILDAYGRAVIWGDGQYRQVVKDRNNNQIWDKLTSASGSSGGGSTTGDGDLVGTIKPWAGLTAPNQYLFAYGQEISRATYSSLFTAITLSTSAFCTNGSPTLTGIADTTQIPIGGAVEISCMAPSTTVLSKTSSTVTLSNNASLTTSATAVFLPWGGGNGTSTFNLPDLRGRVIAGRDNMGGTAASRLTTTYFADANGLGVTGGTQSHTMTSSELVAHTHTQEGQQPTFGYTQNGNVTTGGGTTVIATIIASGGNTITTTADATPGTTGSTGSTTPFTIVQPTILSNYIIKVTPDTAGTTNIGVTSIQGMTGDIACGTGLLCTGNTMTVNGLVGGSNTQVQYNQAGVLGGLTRVIGDGNDISFSGSTSGAIKLIATAIAGSNTLTLPAATDTIAVLAASQAFTNKTYNGNTWTAGTGILTIAASKTLTANNSITLAGTDSTTMTFPSSNGTIATLNLTGQTITGGYLVTSQSISTGSYTVDCGNRPLQYITNGGAFTLTAPANDSSCILLITNNGSAGAITFSGFSVGSNTGDALTTTNTNKFSIHIWRVNGTSGYRVAAHQ